MPAPSIAAATSGQPRRHSLPSRRASCSIGAGEKASVSGVVLLVPARVAPVG
ncbi:hypothetical protein [Sphingomonas sp. BK235]|uniref:hypothetical protein n=1 Tax=Sphingomonas sp. BK235 TaxID=2512131 RepID=UPI001404899B|nr:hypothetical protein [Sphingomonas sp. BK235]